MITPMPEKEMLTMWARGYQLQRPIYGKWYNVSNYVKGDGPHRLKPIARLIGVWLATTGEVIKFNVSADCSDTILETAKSSNFAEWVFEPKAVELPGQFEHGAEHVHCELILKWLNGALIDYFDKTWKQVPRDSPVWEPSCKYRVRPPERQYLLVEINENGEPNLIVADGKDDCDRISKQLGETSRIMIPWTIIPFKPSILVVINRAIIKSRMPIKAIYVSNLGHKDLASAPGSNQYLNYDPLRFRGIPIIIEPNQSERFILKT